MFLQKPACIKFALLLCALAVMASSSVSAHADLPSPACRYIDGWRGTNVPISPGVPATDIIHATAITSKGFSLGWFVVLRDGVVWYFDGPVRGPRPPQDLSLNFLNLIGSASATRHLDSVGRGQMVIQKQPIDLRRIISSGFELQTCY